MTWPDHVLALILVIALPTYSAWDLPRLARRIAADPGLARTREYLWTMVLQWGLALALIGWWVQTPRPFTEIGVAYPEGAAWWWTVGISAAAMAFFAWQARVVATSPDAQAQVREQLATQASVRLILPTTPGEVRVFAALAITAGFSEELFYRGYLLWYLQSWWPGAGAILAAIVVFGAAHAYQGARGILLTALAGAAAMAAYLLTGSLLAPIALHSTIDLANGFIAYKALADPGS